jgi:hypothetical protein
MLLYIAYRFLKPSAPERHNLFIGFAFGIGLFLTFFWFGSSSVAPGLFFFAECAFAYALFRRTMRCSDKGRRVIFVVTLVSLVLLYAGVMEFNVYIHDLKNKCATTERFAGFCPNPFSQPLRKVPSP